MANDRVDESLVETIRTCLEGYIGVSSASVVHFLVDTRLAITDPDAYEKGLHDIFRDGATFVMAKIEEALCRAKHIEPRQWSSLAACVSSLDEQPDRGSNRLELVA